MQRLPFGEFVQCSHSSHTSSQVLILPFQILRPQQALKPNATMRPARHRANSSPSSPQASAISDQPSTLPTLEHAWGPKQSKPDGVPEQPKTRRGTMPSLTFFSDSPPPSAQVGPLRMFRERMRRPTSAGGVPEPKHSRESPNPLSRKSTRTKRAPSRPSTSSGVPERNAINHPPSTPPPRFSMPSVRRRRETSVPPAFPVSSRDPFYFLYRRYMLLHPITTTLLRHSHIHCAVSDLHPGLS